MGSGMALTEWLLRLGSDDAHRKLLDESGSLSAAAWRLARARCVTSPLPTEIPTAREVRGAAREILRRVGLSADPPNARWIAQECEALGLTVIL